MKTKDNRATWNEIVHVQACLKSVEELAESMPAYCAHLLNVPDLACVESFVDDATRCHIVVILQWMPSRKPGRTPEGHLLSEHLKDFGLVDHKILKKIFPAVYEESKLDGVGHD